MSSENHEITLDPKSLEVSRLHAYLLASVAPRPIAFASTVDKKGNINLSPFSFFNVFSSNPPVMIFSPSRRGKDSTQKDTYINIKEVPEVVINIVNFDIVEKMSLASTAYEKDINEFVKAGLSAVPSDIVKPPRVGEAPIAFECKVREVISLGSGGGAGNLVLAEVHRMHFKESYLKENGLPDSTKLDLVGRMGENWYIRASRESLFEIPKPIRTKGIGVDSLPQSVRESDVLTGNNLGRLGNADALPTAEEITAHAQEQEVVTAKSEENPVKSLHQLAQRQLEADVDNALKTLLVADSIGK